MNPAEEPESQRCEAQGPNQYLCQKDSGHEGPHHTSVGSGITFTWMKP